MSNNSQLAMMATAAVTVAASYTAYMIWNVFLNGTENSEAQELPIENQKECLYSNSHDEEKISIDEPLNQLKCTFSDCKVKVMNDNNDDLQFPDRKSVRWHANLTIEKQQELNLNSNSNDERKISIDKPMEEVNSISMGCNTQAIDDSDDDVQHSGKKSVHWDIKLMESNSSEELSSSDDIVDQPSFRRYVSCVADMFKHTETREKEYLIGIKSIDLCWLRGDEGNAPTDYQETLCITENQLAIQNKTKPSFKVPFFSEDDRIRSYKNQLAEAYIEAWPSSVRKTTVLASGIDKIWKEVTVIKKGKVKVNQSLFKKELYWLRSRKKTGRNDSLMNTRLSKAKLSLISINSDS